VLLGTKLLKKLRPKLQSKVREGIGRNILGLFITPGKIEEFKIQNSKFKVMNFVL